MSTTRKAGNSARIENADIAHMRYVRVFYSLKDLFIKVLS